MKRTSIPILHLQILSSGLCFSSCTWWMVSWCSETRKSNGVRMKVNPRICHNILLSQFYWTKNLLTFRVSQRPAGIFFGTSFRFIGFSWIFSKSSIFLLESCWRSVCMTVLSTPTWKRPWKKREDWLDYLWLSPQCIQFFDCCWTCDKHHNHHKPIHLGRSINIGPYKSPI